MIPLSRSCLRGRPYGSQIVDQMGHDLVHFDLRGVQNFFRLCHIVCRFVLHQFRTTVPICSPSITLRRLPGVSMSKTTIGRSFCLHIVKAVRSITFSWRR